MESTLKISAVDEGRLYGRVRVTVTYADKVIVERLTADEARQIGLDLIEAAALASADV